MKFLIRVLLIPLFWVFFSDALAQNYDARINKLLAEVDESEMQAHLALVVDETAATLVRYNITVVALLPFRNSDNHRTGLTEFIAAEFTKNLRWHESLDIFSPEQTTNLAKNRFNLAALRWPQDCAKLAIQLKTAGLLSARLIEGSDSFKMVVEIYDVRQGIVVASHKTDLPRTAGLRRLNDLILPEKAPVRSEEVKKLAPKKQAGADLVMKDISPLAPVNDYVFYEDFQNVAEGMLPKGWLGGDKLMVKSDGRRKFLTDFERQRSHKILIDNIPFPENFELTILFQFGRDASSTHLLAYLGSLTMVIDVFGWYKLNRTKVDKRTDWRNKVMKAILKKEGVIFKLIINGEEMVLIRDQDYKIPQALSLEFRNMSGFKLMKVYLRAI